MKLWLLKTKNTSINTWDSNLGFVIRAETEKIARAMANANAADEGRIWENPEFSSCEKLTTKGKAEIILTDFNAS